MKDKKDKIKEILEMNREIDQFFLARANKEGRSESNKKPLLGSISGGQVHLIMTLRRMVNRYTEGVRLYQLADELGVSAASTSSMVDRLVKKGLIVRVIDEVDRRSVKLYLSKRMLDEFHHQDRLRNDIAMKNLSYLKYELIDTWFDILKIIHKQLTNSNLDMGLNCTEKGETP